MKNTLVTINDVLSENQQARVAALQAAHGVLGAKTILTAGEVDTQPLIDVARYIIEGRDPLESYQVNEIQARKERETATAKFLGDRAGSDQE